VVNKIKKFMPDDNQEFKDNEDIEETGADDGEEDYDQWEMN